MEDKQTISAQEKWSGADTATRSTMLAAISYGTGYAAYVSTSWKKLPYLVKDNLNRRTWTTD